MTSSVSIQPILSQPETSPTKNCPWMKLRESVLRKLRVGLDATFTGRG